MAPLFVLIHSPSVGPATWAPVAAELARRGHEALVPSLLTVGAGEPPVWRHVAAAVADALADVPPDRPVVLVAHSNAGVFIPVVRQAVRQPVAATVFVDALLPARAGATPIAEAEFLGFLRGLVRPDGLLPRWTDWWDDADIAPMFPDEATRRVVIEEQPRLPLSYYEQAVPVPDGWADHPCAYLLFAPEAYQAMADEARARGWPVRHLPGEHLHQIVDPAAVTDGLLSLSGVRVPSPTPRLLFREMTVDDLDDMAALLGDRNVMRYYPRPKDRDEALAWISWNQGLYRREGFGLWVISGRGTGEFVGDCGLTPQEIEGTTDIEVGYHVRADLQGHGYATEAAAACRDHARDMLGLKRLIAIINPANGPSQRVAEKIGLTYERDAIYGARPARIYATSL